jgi:hypothetical protein
MKYSKRKFIYNSCCLCLGAFAFSQISYAKKKDTIIKFEGDVLLNGKKMQTDLAVKYNDKIETKSASQAVVSLDDDIFQIRENTIFELPSKNESKSGGKLLAGAILASFTPGKPKSLQVENKGTIGIRGTGIYLEIEKEQTQFCLCYGKAEIFSKNNKLITETDTKFHKDFLILNDGTIKQTEPLERKLNHTSRQNIDLENFAGRPSPFIGSFRDIISNFQSPI